MFGCAVPANLILSGFPQTFGIFLSYYDRNQVFQSSRFLPVIGALATVGRRDPCRCKERLRQRTSRTDKFPLRREFPIWAGPSSPQLQRNGTSTSGK